MARILVGLTVAVLLIGADPMSRTALARPPQSRSVRPADKPTLGKRARMFIARTCLVMSLRHNVPIPPATRHHDSSRKAVVKRELKRSGVCAVGAATLALYLGAMVGAVAVPSGRVSLRDNATRVVTVEQTLRADERRGIVVIDPQGPPPGPPAWLVDAIKAADAKRVGTNSRQR